MLVEPNLDVMLHDKRVGNKFALVTLALKRARQINDGSPALVALQSLKKPVSQALEEIMAYQVKAIPAPPDEGPRFTVESSESGS
ncbi:DNA-directed RNA polymerase subunit omega [bacterium]|nr:DNA-directed RNA polymerase subunit omega [bacterium]